MCLERLSSVINAMLLLSLVSGCCDAPPLALVDPGVVDLDVDEIARLNLSDLGVDDPEAFTWTVESDPGVEAELVGEVLRIAPDEGWTGVALVNLIGENACELSDGLVLEVQVGDVVEPGDACETVFRFDSSTADVAVAGSFNDWTPQAMDLVNGGWELRLELDPGSYTYKYVDGGVWVSPPEAEMVQCDAGSALGDCNGLVVVSDCAVPKAWFSSVDIDRDNNALSAVLSTDRQVAHTYATLNGEVVVDEDGAAAIELSDLGDGRQTLRVVVTDKAGVESEELYLPFWTDERDWASGLMYYVFVDRFSDGDTSLNGDEGTNADITDYMGGDWQGVIERLDYLDDLGVTVIWLTAPQNQPAGAWGEKCGANFSGYHGYWPQDSVAVEDHFGDVDLLHTLIDEAHARGIRVLTDWVANHVHEDHDWVSAHPDWFNDELICQGDVWNTHPETCWFDGFLPDINYNRTEPLVQSVDDAMWWAKEYELDGYRVDAVKHMPHSVYVNFQSRVRNEIEHADAGGDEDFYTVGETFTGDRGVIMDYVNEDELDAQFDFPLYYAILGVLGRGEGSMTDLDGALADSSSAYAGFTMSTFLGNHDVERFISHAAGEVGNLYGDGACGGDGWLRGPAWQPGWDEPYLRLKLAWTFLLTNEGLPLVYYGDELGMPGYHDPDNRQMMRFDSDTSGREQMVLAHVQALGQARLQHPALSVGDRTGWWAEDDVLAWARVSGDSQALVVINRSGSERTLTNGLSFAGLSDGAFTDVLTGETITGSGDSLTVTVPAMGSRVLVR